MKSLFVFLFVSYRTCGFFSFAQAVLRKYGPLLRSLVSTEEDGRVQVLRLAGNFWESSEGMRLMCAELFMTSGIVDNLSIVAWVFSESDRSASLLGYAPWEALHMAVQKTLQKTALLRQLKDAAKLDVQLREEKDLFLTIFQRFAIVMESYLAESGAAPGQENNWFKAVLAQMVAFERRYSSAIAPFASTLRSVVFSQDCDERIRSAFRGDASDE